MKPLTIVNTISINASAVKVWDALTNPEQTKKYMFGCETISDWKKGSTLIWKMIHEGKDFIPVKGHIVEIEPNKLLTYTVIDPNNPNIPDIPENYLSVTYLLEEKNIKNTYFKKSVNQQRKLVFAQSHQSMPL